VSRRTTGRKGTFGDLGLSVAKVYQQRRSRRQMLVIAGTLALAVIGVVLSSHFVGGGELVSNGPLYSGHAAFGNECSNCHLGPGHSGLGGSVTDEKCSVCHEKFGDELGVYTFSAHYLYRSNDFQRLVPSSDEMPCSSCHTEHEGRYAEITKVPDRRCETCHFSRFGNDHPQFDFVAEEANDNNALAFPHIHHVREVMKRQQLEDVEKSCLYCHNPKADGRSFEPLEFDRHCDTCHLTATTATPGLPIESADESVSVGVVTLEEIAQRGGPGARWAYFTNPNEFRVRGSVVVKGPLHHRDPWILDNLRSLRQRLYPDAGLADLLRTSAESDSADVRPLYEEAIRTLEEQAIGLRSRPEHEIQAELTRINELLEQLKQDLEGPYAPLDETEFLLAFDRKDESLSAEEVGEIDALVDDLTLPCRQCHQVEAATIRRVQKDQRTLHRAHFNHRAHIVQARCLDCHDRIPVLELASSLGKVDVAIDGAQIQNLPSIESCGECHTPKLASDRCITCHYFHPNKNRRSDLLLYLDESP